MPRIPSNFHELKYSPRLICLAELWQMGEWIIKIYSISQFNRRVPEDLIKHAKAIATTTFPADAFTSQRYGTGFIIVHEASLFNQLTFDWWERVNELRHIVYKSSPHGFMNITGSGELFCIWELKIIAFERDLWLTEILEQDGKQDFERYLNTVLEGYY